MGHLIKHEHYFTRRYTTGPQDLLLMLDLQPERIADPFVTALETCTKYGKPKKILSDPRFWRERTAPIPNLPPIGIHVRSSIHIPVTTTSNVVS